MAFRTPNMPLLCDIYDDVGFMPPVGAARMINVPCQLRFLKSQFADLAATGTQASTILLLVPKLTDIRMLGNANQPDIVEVPPGTGRFYHVNAVDDVAKGFANEYRAASLRSANDVAGCWPTPYA